MGNTVEMAGGDMNDLLGLIYETLQLGLIYIFGRFFE